MTLGPSDDSSLDRYFLRQLKEAIPLAKKNTDRLQKYESTIPRRVIIDWEARIAKWDATRDKKHSKCPYLEPIRGTHDHATRTRISMLTAA